MTRKADIKSVEGFSIRARGESEKKMIQDLKKLSVQDDLELADLIFEGIGYTFRAHHWPPGNPQLSLSNFQEGTIQIELKCSHCSNQAIKIGLNLKSNQESCFCKHHFSELPMRYDPKVWRWKT
jgi:hypothetical protein